MRTWIMAGTLAGLASLAACGGDRPAARVSAQSGGAPEQLAAEQATATAERGAQVLYVDVRTPQEFAAGHVAGAVNIPHDQMEARWSELAGNGDSQIVLYCRSGRRSGIAKGVLDRSGVENVVNAGGLADLQARGVPVVR